MKRIVLFGILAVLLVLSCFASPLQKAYMAGVSPDNSVIILSGGVNEQNKLVIRADLTINTGISSMLLELSYNKNAMTLSNVVFGSALSSLSPIHTDTSSQGYSITPFKFSYEGRDNDLTTGTLFTMTFNLPAHVDDGSYMVSLKYTKNKDVNYFYNGSLRTKNLYIDNAEITFKDNSVSEVTSVRDEESSRSWILVLGISVFIFVTGGAFVCFKLFRKRKDWEQI